MKIAALPYVLFVVLSSLHLAQAIEWTTVQLTDNTVDDFAQGISGKNVVWDSYNGNGYDTFLHDGVQTIELSEEPYKTNIHPIAAGNRVIWEADTGDLANEAAVFLFDGETTTRLTHSALHGYHDVSEEFAVWVDKERQGGGIFVFDGTNTTKLSDAAVVPYLSGSNVVWSEPVGGDHEIFLYDGTRTVQVTDNDIDDAAPIASIQTVTWSGGRGNEREVFLYDGNMTERLTEVTEACGPRVIPSFIEGERIIAGFNDGQDDEVCYYNGQTAKRLTDDTFYNHGWGISAKYVLLSRDAGDVSIGDHDFEFLLYDDFKAQRIPLNVQRITQNDHRDDIAVGLYEDESSTSVLWQGHDGHDYEVFVATRPVQKVHLAFDAEEVPIDIEQLCVFDKCYDVYIEQEGEMPGIVGLPRFDEYTQRLRANVETIFSNSGVTNIEFVDEPDGATVVWFARRPDDRNWGLAGKAFLGDIRDLNAGIDRLNRNVDDSVVVFVNDNLLNDETEAESVAHELGHAFGVRHINPEDEEGAEIPLIMDYDREDGLQQFFEGVTQIVEPPEDGKRGNFPSKGTHNPIYHLYRYVDAVSDADLRDMGIRLGGWDLDIGGLPTIVIGLGFSNTESMLYDVTVFSGHGDDDSTVLAQFDEIQIGDLAEQIFHLDAGMGFGMVGATTPDAGWDVLLSAGDPFEEDGINVTPERGENHLLLQQISMEEPKGYVTLSTVVMEAVFVPEPSNFVLAVLAVMSLLFARRRRSR